MLLTEGILLLIRFLFLYINGTKQMSINFDNMNSYNNKLWKFVEICIEISMEIVACRCFFIVKHLSVNCSNFRLYYWNAIRSDDNRYWWSKILELNLSLLTTLKNANSIKAKSILWQRSKEYNKHKLKFHAAYKILKKNEG